MFEKMFEVYEKWRGKAIKSRERQRQREKEQQLEMEREQKKRPLLHKVVIANVPVVYSGLFTRATQHTVTRRCVVEEEQENTVRVSFLAEPNARSADCILVNWIPKSDILEIIDE